MLPEVHRGCERVGNHCGDIALSVLIVRGVGQLAEIVQPVLIELRELAVDEELLVSLQSALLRRIALGP
jgi:hypothetical protein